MRSLTVRPGVRDSLRLIDMPEPARSEGPVLVSSVEVGLCATDVEIVNAENGQAPPGGELLVLGHENLGRVLRSDDPAFRAGDLVVGFVRRPDPVPCPACAIGEWDMCHNGLYTSHGITRLHGFARERWRSSAQHLIGVDRALVDVGVLVEPASVVAKAWEQIDRIGQRAGARPRVVAVTGAGPVGLLAALLAAQRGYEVHVFDRVTDGPKPDLVTDLGARYHPSGLRDSTVTADVVLECTGVPSVIVDALLRGAPGSITCLLGMSSGAAVLPVDVAAVNRRLVRQNGIVLGTVNANRRHYEAAAAALGGADRAWLARLVSRRVPVRDFADAFRRHPDDVKVVLTF